MKDGHRDLDSLADWWDTSAEEPPLPGRMRMTLLGGDGQVLCETALSTAAPFCFTRPQGSPSVVSIHLEPLS